LLLLQEALKDRPHHPLCAVLRPTLSRSLYRLEGQAQALHPLQRGASAAAASARKLGLKGGRHHGNAQHVQHRTRGGAGAWRRRLIFARKAAASGSSSIGIRVLQQADRLLGCL